MKSTDGGKQLWDCHSVISEDYPTFLQGGFGGGEGGRRHGSTTLVYSPSLLAEACAKYTQHPTRDQAGGDCPQLRFLAKIWWQLYKPPSLLNMDEIRLQRLTVKEETHTQLYWPAPQHQPHLWPSPEHPSLGQLPRRQHRGRFHGLLLSMLLNPLLRQRTGVLWGS